MSSTANAQIGWQQIRAGVELIKWSRLAHWNEFELRFVAASQDEFEPIGWQPVHNEFGRLICWIIFGVGSEYLAKGFCLVKKSALGKLGIEGDKTVLKSPALNENINQWVQTVVTYRNSSNKNLFKQANSTFFENVPSFRDLNEALKDLERMMQPGEERDFVIASFELLRESIRNRDAHHYARDKRAFHFHTVEMLFVKAFNILLTNLDQDELRYSLSKL